MSNCLARGKFLFAPLALKWNDSAIGALLLILALVVLCACLALIVKILHSLLRGTIAKVIKKLFNSDFPGKLSFLTGYVAIIIGAGLTFVVQSSSIFTSSLTPLVGMGVISIYRVYPLTLGSNIGTTTTGILAAIAQSPAAIPRALQVAFCHLFFNITGILIFYPLPFMRFPIPLAKFLGDTTAEYRWFAILYLIFCFFLLPAAIFALSIPPWYVMAAILIPVAVLILFVVVINVLQKKFPNVLPSKLKTWEFLPLWMRSLKPLDKVIRKIISVCRVCKPKRTGQNQAIGSKSDINPVFSPRQDSYKKAHLISMRDLNEKFA